MSTRQVAEFPPSRPALTRTPKNPIDKSTIISIYPREINESKFTLQPTNFRIPAGTLEKPGVLVIGTASWWTYSGDNRPTIEVPVSSVAMADALIGDFCKGMLECDMVDARPGLIFIPGEYNYAEIMTNSKIKEALNEAAAKQKNWYYRLVKIADSLWARSNGNPLSIPDDSRLAAEQLQLKDKPWMQDYRTIQLVPCIACGSLKNPAFPVCSSCKAIDPTYNGEIKFAGNSAQG